MQKDLLNYIKEKYMYVYKKIFIKEFINTSIRKLIADDSLCITLE